MAGEGMKYNVPEWGCNCQKQYQYFMEIIKGGEEIGRVEFDEQETLIQPGGWLLIGRLPPDDPLPHLTMTHPSVSRQHAALQMKGNGQMYLYDLGSTHGSFLNKRKVRPKTFIPLRCGDLLRFGQSSRMYHLTSRSPSVLESIDLPISDLQAHVKATPEVFNGNYHELKAFMKKKEASQKATKKPARPGDSSEDEDEAQESSSAAFGSDEETSRVNDGNYFLGADGEDDPGEDDFFDRTRKAKKFQRRKLITPKTLKSDLETLEKEIATIHTEIERIRRSSSAEQADANDSLDSFMTSVFIEDQVSQKG